MNYQDLSKTELIAELNKLKHEIDSLRNTEHALADSQVRFKTVFEDAPLGVALIDSVTGKIYEVNQKFAAIAGRTIDEMTKIDWVSITHPDDIQEDLDNMAKLVRGEINGFQMEKRYIRPDSSLVWINMTISRLLKIHDLPLCHLCMIEDISVRKQEEEVLKSQADLLNLAHDSIIVRDLDSRITYWNKGAEEQYGWKSDEAIGKITHNLLQTIFPQPLEEILNDLIIKEYWEGELIHNRKDGSKIFVSSRWQLKRDAGGNPVTIFEINNDITARKQFEEAINFKSSLLEAQLNATDEGVLVFDENFKKILINQRVTELFNLPADVAMSEDGSVILKYIAGLTSTPEKVITRVKHLMANPNDSDLYEMELMNGMTVRRFTSPIIDKNGRYFGRIATFHDITSYKEAVRQIRELNLNLEQKISERTAELTAINNSFKFAQKASNSGTWDWDIVNNKFFWSEEYLKLNGMDTNTIPGVESWLKSIHPEDVESAGKRIEDSIISKKPLHNEYRIILPDGKVRWIRSLGETYFDGNTPLRMVGLSIDITNEKNAESTIIKALTEAKQANIAKSEFLSRMSHELRTPLNSILGFAQLLQMGDLNPAQKKGVDRIMNSGKQLLELINDVLDITRIDTGHLSLLIEPLIISDLLPELMDYVQHLSDKNQIQLKAEDSIQSGNLIKADRKRLMQVMKNLVMNAVKFNHKGGSVTISAETIQGKDNQEFIRILVKDTGIGISQEDMVKLFKPFEIIGDSHTQYQGTGLGLAVVKRLMDAMNGNVGVESTPGVGSTFWIELPCIRCSLNEM